jgi:hypothetical protein
VEIAFQETEVNSKKIYCLDRRSMRCLQQSQPGGNSSNFWLNDEVVNAYCGLIVKCRNRQLGKQSVYPISSNVATTVWKGSGRLGITRKIIYLNLTSGLFQFILELTGQ